VENLGRIVTMRMHEESYDAVIPCVIVCCIKEEMIWKIMITCDMVLCMECYRIMH
jgi:hypothetical protein